jgi:hypothetical protein
MVTTGSQKITLWGSGGNPLGILRVKKLPELQGGTYFLASKIPTTARIMISRLQNIPIEIIPGVPMPS